MEEEREDVVEGWCSLHPGMLWRGGVPYIHNVTNHYFTVQRWGDEEERGSSSASERINEVEEGRGNRVSRVRR